MAPWQIPPTVVLILLCAAVFPSVPAVLMLRPLLVALAHELRPSVATVGQLARATALTWVPDKWWKLLTGTSRRTRTPPRVARRHFEVCVFSQVMTELLSGGMCIEGSV
jgi:hypothetical protein